MMNHTSSKAKGVIRRVSWRHESGQALVEFSLVALMLLSLTFGLIDFYRALYEKEVLANLTREAANESARGSGTSTWQIMSNAMLAVASSSESFALNSTNKNGVLILTAITNDFSGKTSKYIVSQQMEEGKLAATSKVGPQGLGYPAFLPKPTNTLYPMLQSNRTVYVAEIFYSFKAVTPIGALIKATLTNQFYDVAYFPGG
jgi:Flp pilus assembly protein TadG